MVIDNTSVRGQVSCVTIWVDSLAFKSLLPSFPLTYLALAPVTLQRLLQKDMLVFSHLEGVKFTWQGVTYLACNSGHVSRLTWPPGITWLVTTSSSAVVIMSRQLGQCKLAFILLITEFVSLFLCFFVSDLQRQTHLSPQQLICCTYGHAIWHGSVPR